MLNIKKLKSEITTGIIISILMLVFVQPIMTYFWNLMSSATSGFYSYYLDRAYSNAAIGQRNWLDFLILYLFLIVILVVINTYFLKMRMTIDNYIYGDKLISTENGEEKKEIILKEINSNSNKIGTYINKHINKFRFFTYISQIFTIILACHIIFTSYVDLQLNSSFKQRLTIIAPYISEQEEEILLAKWALMQNKSDNIKINLELENLAKAKKIILPKLLLQ